MMKAGQILSMLDAGAIGTGAFSPHQKALTRLQTNAPPMHPALVHDILTSELRPITTVFRKFADEPVAAASVGQVHRTEHWQATLSLNVSCRWL